MSTEIDKAAVSEIIRKKIARVYIPSSIYRLQFNSQFNFNQARKVIPYLSELGVDAVYASPFFQATPGSLHGYDVTDPNQINPEIGSEKEFNRYCARLQKHGVGQILDVVPNHMGITGSHNPWWTDVLENGPSSLYAKFFDIDWEHEKKELKNKVLLPFLGNQYGDVLENQELQLGFSDGAFTIQYWDNRFPVAPETYPDVLEHDTQDLIGVLGAEDADFQEYMRINKAFRELPSQTQKPDEMLKRNREKEILKHQLDELSKRSQAVRKFIQQKLHLFNGSKENPKSFDLLDGLLNRQSFRLAFWRVAAHEINYRRFFNINGLAAIRIEEPEVFDAYHWFTFCLLKEGKIRGLRIDHPDGLYDPSEYFHRLQRKYLVQSVVEELKRRQGPQKGKRPSQEQVKKMVEEILKERESQYAAPLYIVVEKILDRKEPLPDDWEVHGTVGYGFGNALNGLFVDREQENAFNEIYEKFIGFQMDFEQLVYEKKKFFAAFYMSSEINNLGHRLDQLSERNRHFRDFTLSDLATAIREVIACFPVYRTYISPDAAQVSPRDEKYIHIAVEKAKGKHPALSSTLFEYIRDVLLLKYESGASPTDKLLFREFILRFQQLSAPIMAKGLEDTAFYIYNRLLSLNEVGGDPIHFGVSKGDFHRGMNEKAKKWPAGVLSTSTHDSKRSEDVRMRINVLTEVPKDWNSAIARWTRLNEKHKTLIGKYLEPRPNTEYFIYQTLLGAWPEESMKKPGALETFKGRVWECVQKSLREAKLDTNWLNPNEVFEQAVKKFFDGILERDKENKFYKSFRAFQKKVSEFGKWNSLSALVLKMAAPGVVDTYQGNELWNYRLVDPDNRAPVDYKRRIKTLSKIKKMFQGDKDNERKIAELLEEKADGRIKQYLIWKGLNFKKRFPDFFLTADYIPLEVRGEKQEHVIAFLRRKENKYLIACAGRFFAKLHGFEEFSPLLTGVWQDTKVVLSKDMEKTPLADLFTGKKIMAEDDGGEAVLPLAMIFQPLRAAILTNLNEK